jgi:glycosyltransferase involved in cell wall biosynthesis
LSFAAQLEKNIIVIPRGKRSGNYVNNFLYELWLPFKHSRVLKGCDIFKTNQNSGSIAAAIAKLLYPKKKLVVRSGYIGSELARRSKLSFLIRSYYFLAEHFSYRVCDQALISAEPNRQLLGTRYPFLQNQLVTHNNFIDTNLFKKDPSIEKRFDIIYVARFDRDKNHRVILDALRGSNYTAHFIGQGRTLSSVKTEAISIGIQATFEESVRNEDLPSIYNAARICVFPSLHEGSPKSLLEAMACELPVAALHAPGVSNIISNERNGLISDETGFKANIQRLLNDPSLRDTLGHAARKTVLNDYSFDKVAEQEIKVYKKLLSSYG